MQPRTKVSQNYETTLTYNSDMNCGVRVAVWFFFFCNSRIFVL